MGIKNHSKSDNPRYKEGLKITHKALPIKLKYKVAKREADRQMKVGYYGR